MRNSILAVLPSIRFSSVGSCKPGTCTRIRSVPCRWISGSTVPSSLTRRSTIWIDCSMVCRMRSVIAACGTVRRISPPPASRRLQGCAGRWSRAEPPSGCDSSRSLVSAVGRSVSLTRTSTLSARDGKAGIADLGLAQHAADVVAHLVELFLLDVVGIDFEQQIRAALQIEAEHEVALRPCRPGLDLGLGEEIRNGATGTPPAPSE